MEAAPPPVSVSLGVVRSLPTKLEQLLSPEAAEPSHAGLRMMRETEKSKIRLLMDHLRELIDNYLLEPSEVEAPTPSSAARCWAREVRELSYDIDDFLDELVHRLHGAANNHGKLARLREGLGRSHWVADEASRFRARIEDAIQRHKRFDLDKCKSQQPNRIDSNEPKIGGPPYGVEAARRLVGIDDSMEKLGEWLTGDGERRLRVVAVVGVGGVGKTTVARQLYNQFGKLFECRAFVQSSQKPDVRRLLTSILLQVRRHQPPDDVLELHNLVGVIRTHLQDKKYFIIIDDLWASSTWDVVHQALPDDKCFSRVLITTENDILAQQCCLHNSECILKMGPLRDNESRKLFFSIVNHRNQSENCEEFNKGSYEIIRKCGGYPLATVAIAGLLAAQQNRIEQCNYIRRSLSFSLHRNPTVEGMKEVLSFCYNNLPERLKPCMLYLSIYKEDHIIWKEDLVKQWIAEGFIIAKEDMEEVARTYFNELVNVGMIQPVDIQYNGEVVSCHVHYMILNIIRHKSIEENFVTAIDHNQANLRLADKVRRLSLYFGDAEDTDQPESLRLLQVRSLFFSGLLKSLHSTKEFQLLRVLILYVWSDQDNRSFNFTTVKLFRLKYLQIVCNATLNLQNQMQGLLYLETLKIDSRINEVPPDIVYLPRLLHLSLPSDTSLPNGIGCMASLQTLACFDLSRNSEDNVTALGELTNLRDLHLACSTTSDNLEKKLQHLGSVLWKLSNLKSLTLVHAESSNADTLETCISSKSKSYDFYSMPTPPALLQNLELRPRVCIFSILPKWIGKLHLLTTLKIEIMELFSEDVDILKVLPVLTDLSLYVHTVPAQRIVFDKEGFSVLKNLKFICAAPLITFVEEALPTVQRLKLGFSVNTMKQLISLIDVGFKNLIGLEVFYAKIRCASPDESGREAVKFALKEAFTHHPSPPAIIIHWVDSIFDKDKEKQADSRIVQLSGPSSHTKDPNLSSHMQKAGDQDKETRTAQQDYQIMKEQNVIVEHADIDEPHGIQVNELGEVTSKETVTGSSTTSSNMQKQARTPWQALRSIYSRSTGTTGSKNSRKTTTYTNTSGTKTSSPSRLVASTDMSTSGTKTSGSSWLPLNNKSTTETEILELPYIREFTLSELRGSTKNFKKDLILADEDYSTVYKGWVDELTLAPTKPGTGMTVVVKCQKNMGSEGHREWMAEVNYRKRLFHPNLVKFIGYCFEEQQSFLVYEFMSRGSFEHHLFRRGSHIESLSWNIRMKVALTAARVLAFLHGDQANVIYRDFKASNILLDSEYNAKLNYFGLAKDGPCGDNSHVSTRVMGTYGYAAPEYIATGHLTKKCDVYSYGVVLLELLMGQRAIDDSRPSFQRNLVEWARPYIQDKRRFTRILDPRLASQYPHRAAFKMAKLAWKCLLGDPRRRPSMDNVVFVLEGLSNAKES